MLNLKTGKQFDGPSAREKMTRREFGKGLAAIIGAGVAPSIALGTVSLAGSANASVGRGMMRNVGARNAAMFGGEKKPYDEEVNYIENTVNQYIDTLVVPNDCCMTIRFALSRTGQSGQIAGCHNPNNQRYYPLQLYQVTFQRTDKYNSFLGNLSIQDTEIHETKYYEGNNAWFDGALNQSANYAISSAIYTALIFGISIGGVYSSSNIALMKLYSCQMVDNSTGNTLRDFIPVIKDNVAYLYDKCGSICPLTGTPLYANAGTGAFTWG